LPLLLLLGWVELVAPPFPLLLLLLPPFPLLLPLLLLLLLPLPLVLGGLGLGWRGLKGLYTYCLRASGS
jgi:hypothetical protein